MTTTPTAESGPEKNLVNRDKLASELGCDRRTIAKWQDEGLPVALRGRGGRSSLFDLEACRAWRDARRELDQAVGPVDLMRERARRERAQALLAEQLHATRGGRLVSVEDVERTWSKEVAGVRSKLLAWPTTLADKVFRAATVDGIAGVERVLLAAVHDALTELSRGGRPRRGPRRAPKKGTGSSNG